MLIVSCKLTPRSPWGGGGDQIAIRSNNDTYMMEELKTNNTSTTTVSSSLIVSRTGRDMQRYNSHGHRLVVGCIPYRYKCPRGTSIEDEEEIEVLVITSQKKGKGMLFPKGGWENDESIEDAALRETVEEAGVLGDVQHKLGKWNFKGKNNDNYTEVHMFPLLVQEQLEFWPEKDVRERIWISVREARKVCQYWWMKEALELLVTHLTTSQSNVATKTEVVQLDRARNLTVIAKA